MPASIPKAPPPTSPLASRRFRNTPTRDTPAELALRRALFRRGLRYRVDARPLPTLNRRADLVFAKGRVAVFVDGCYWHGCPKHYKGTSGNAEWWRTKIEGNRARDHDTNQRLRAEGWLPIRIWEHEASEVAAEHVAKLVIERRSAAGALQLPT